MATIISIGVDSPSGVGTVMFRSQMTDDDAARIMAAYTALLGPITIEEEVDGVLTPVTRPRTPREVAQSIHDATIAGLLENTHRWEVAQAAAAAAAAVAPIVATNIVPE